MFLSKNKCFCQDCHKIFDAADAVYVGTDHDLQTSVQFRLEGRTPVLLDQTHYRLENQNQRAPRNRGVVDFMELEVFDVEQSRKLSLVAGAGSRQCPDCKAELHPLMGTGDSYLIALVGPVRVGKTSISQSILTTQVQRELEKILGCRIMSHTTQFRIESEATMEGTLDIKHCFQLQKGRRLVNIFLADVAGETFSTSRDSCAQSAFQLRYAKILKKHCDGLLLLYDIRDTVFGKEKQNTAEKKMSAINPLLCSLGKRIPIACVLTKADLFRDTMLKRGRKTMMAQDLPVLTVNSPMFEEFDHENATQAMSEHMAIARDVITAFVKTDINVKPDTACFVVSAGRKTDQLTIDLQKQRNVLLPVLWMLRQLVL